MTQDEIEARGEFTPRTQGEIDRNLFAARTGGLVAISGAAFFEMYYAAKAWQRLIAEKRAAAPLKRWYMRDNHTFLQLDDDDEIALADVLGDFDAGYTHGMLCAKRGKDNPFGMVHAGGKSEREKFAADAREWLARSHDPSPLAPQARDTETCEHLRTVPVKGGPPEPSGGQPMRCLDCGMDFVLLPQARDTTPSDTGTES